jgi:uncharacterized protein (TIGR03435 family)
MKAVPRRRGFFALLLFAAVVFQVQAQAPASQTSGSAATGSAATPAPAFEVASVRLGDQHPAPFGPGDQPWSRFPTNRFYAHNVDLKIIIGLAFGVDGEYIEGAPGWTDSTIYTIDAKVEGDQKLSADQMRPLLQNLLAQRLGLKVHHISRPGAGFDLVVAKDGPKLQPAKPRRRTFGQVLPDALQAWNIDTKGLSSFLALPIGKPVVDKTGLTGHYDVTLKYAPSNDPNSSLPSIFTAIQEQLGLKLEPAKVPVNYLVIDHVDRVPAEN